MAAKKWKFTLEPGYFTDHHSKWSSSDDGTKITTEPGLAILPRSYPSDTSSSSSDARQWPRLTSHVAHLNASSPSNVRYKIMYLTRHGIGFHNQKHAEVGEEAWENHWSLLDGDDKTTWFDSFLAPEGIEQAKELSGLWTTFIDSDGAPLPQSHYCSPLARCLQTCTYVFKPVMKDHDKIFHPTVKERLRERWTTHTCDKRRTASWIKENWSEDFTLDDGFVEEDQLCKLPRWETDEEHTLRKQLALEDLFETDENQVVSWTFHSLALKAFFMACGEKPFQVREATSIAVLVKGEKL